jgi:hypothetical protein
VAIYASVSDLESYVADNPEVTLSGGSEAVERLLQRAERDVDRALGPYPVLATGRKLDPTVISAPQRGALARRPVQRPSITCRSARRGTSATMTTCPPAS